MEKIILLYSRHQFCFESALHNANPSCEAQTKLYLEVSFWIQGRAVRWKATDVSEEHVAHAKQETSRILASH
jgi:hypothetical protein